MSDVTSLQGWGRKRQPYPVNGRCAGCGFTHPRCESQAEAERLVYQLADVIETRDPLKREEALEAFRRWTH